MTKIEWAEKVWNPITGCTKVSEGCRYCYAERMAHRLRGRHGYPREEPFGVTLHPDRLEQPLRWLKPRGVFVCSMSDLFHEQVPVHYVDRVFAVMAHARQHVFFVLTKRPFGLHAYLSLRLAGEDRHVYLEQAWRDLGLPIPPVMFWPLPNVVLMTSCEDQETFDERVALLLDTPAAMRGVSLEPLLEPIDPRPAFRRRALGDCLPGVRGLPITRSVMGPGGLDWVIVGGESGPGARPCDVGWMRSIVAHCAAAGVSCFVKQLGSNPIMRPGPISVLCSDPKGCDPDEWPIDLRVRQYPRGISESDLPGLRVRRASG